MKSWVLRQPYFIFIAAGYGATNLSDPEIKASANTHIIVTLLVNIAANRVVNDKFLLLFIYRLNVIP